MMFAELVVSLQRQGKTASSYLKELYGRYVLSFVFLSLSNTLPCYRYGFFQVGHTQLPFSVGH